MRRSEAQRVAETIKAAKPDPASATVGERLLWGRLAQAFYTLMFELAPSHASEWRRLAGMDEGS